jgi:hypothetical protein
MTIEQTIIDKLNLTDLPKDKQETILTKMAEVVLKRVFLVAMENLSPEEQDEFLSLSEENPKSAEEFLLEKVPDFDALAQKEIASFRDEMQKETAENMAVLENK